MTKKQLIQLLILDVIERKTEEEIKFLLELNQDEIEMLLNNKDKAKFLYRLIRIFKNKENYKEKYHFILDNALKLKNENLYKMFQTLVTNETLLESSHYIHTIEVAIKIEEPLIFEKFVGIVTQGSILKCNNYDLDKIINLNLEQMDLIKRILWFDEYLNKLEFIDYVCKLKDERILTKLASFFDTTFKFHFTIEELNCIFDSILNIIKINNNEVILELLEEILNKIEKKIELSQKNQSIEKMFERSIKERNIINVILNSKNIEIIESLSVLDDDEQITPNTFVKKIKM